MSSFAGRDRVVDALEALNSALDNLDALKTLDNTSARLAQSEDFRQEVGNGDPPIWPLIGSLWQKLNESMDEDQAAMQRTTLSVARFTRNLVAGVEPNQLQAFAVEPELRNLIHKYTAYSMTQNPDSHPATRMLIQTLSNLVTASEMLLQRIWTTYMNLPEQQNILIRMFALPDDRAVASAFVFVLNCVFQSPGRMQMLISYPAGLRVCVALLDRMAVLVDLDESSDGGKAFGIAYRIFEQLLHHDLASQLFRSLIIEGEIVTPHQVTFLKILDSYIQSKPAALGQQDVMAFMVPHFFDLSNHAQASIRRSLDLPPGASGTTAEEHTPLQELDLMLPKVCEAIVLVSQCFCTLSLPGEPCRPQLPSATPSTLLIEAVSPQNQGLIENLVGLMRSLNEFLPRVALGRIITPDGRISTSTPSAHTTGFNYLKRDLVRLLGILCYNNKAVQDRVRVCEGIPVVMNMCTIDERNPYLREHAIFTLRNLLHENLENQAVVDQIQPMGGWGDDGVLRDTPGIRK